jgi:branched-chain amino acid transport system permease protein
VRLGRVSAIVWVIAAVLAVVAGVFLGAFPSPGVSPTTSAAALRAFPAAILGGLDSTGGALVGGLLIGLAETLTQGYQDQLSFLGQGFSAVMPYVVMVAVLLVRPTGLFGTTEATRV